jgi:hypothetical protein
MFFSIKKSHLSFVKDGWVSIYGTTSKGIKYVRGKIYLKGSDDIGSRYQFFEIENIHLIEHKAGSYRKFK